MRTGMTIAVLGATGTVGRRVVDEASARGHRVLALSRKPGSEDPGNPKSPNVTPIAVDANDPHTLRETLTGGAADAVVLTVRTMPVDEEFLVGTTRTVLDIAARLGIRVLVVGGAGALRSPGDRDLPVADNPAYVPAEFKAVAAAGIAQLRTCRSHARTGGSSRPARRGAPGPAGSSRLRVEVDGVTLVDLDQPVEGVSVVPGAGGEAEVEVRPPAWGAQVPPLTARGRTVTVSGAHFRYRADAVVSGPVRTRTWVVREGAWGLTLPAR